MFVKLWLLVPGATLALLGAFIIALFIGSRLYDEPGGRF